MGKAVTRVGTPRGLSKDRDKCPEMGAARLLQEQRPAGESKPRLGHHKYSPAFPCPLPLPGEGERGRESTYLKEAGFKDGTRCRLFFLSCFSVSLSCPFLANQVEG